MRTLTQSLPRGWLLFVSAVVVLLVANDAWPDSGYVDTDLFGWLLSLAAGATALVVAIGRDRLVRRAAQAGGRVDGDPAVDRWRAGGGRDSDALGVPRRHLHRAITAASSPGDGARAAWFNSTAVSFASGSSPPRRRPASTASRSSAIPSRSGTASARNNGSRTRCRRRSGRSSRSSIWGCRAHNMPQHLDLVRREVLALHPAFVLLQWFVNDVEGNTLARPTYAPLLPFRRPARSPGRRSAFYTLLNSWWTRQQVRMQSGQSYPDYLQATYGDPQSEAARADELATRTLLRTLRDAHIGAGMVLFPDSGYDLGPSYPFAFLHSRVLAICEDEHVHAIDLRPVFAGSQAAPTALGQRPGCPSERAGQLDRRRADSRGVRTRVVDRSPRLPSCLLTARALPRRYSRLWS